MDGDVLRQAGVVTGVVAGLAVGATGDYGSAGDSGSLVIPADYAFAIWAPIYLGSLAYAWHQARPSRRHDPLLRRVGWASALGYLSVGFWVRTDPAQTFWLTEALVAVSLVSAATAFARLGPAEGADRAERWLVRAPLGLFAGWVTLAAAANTTEALLANDVRELGGLGAEPWAVAVLLVAGGVAAAATLRTRASLAYPAALAWGFVGAAVQQLPRSATVGTTAVAMALTTAAAAWLSSRRPRAARLRRPAGAVA